MYMFGYYEGNIPNGPSLNIPMGRMAACIPIVVTSHLLSEYAGTIPSIATAIIRSISI